MNEDAQKKHLDESHERMVRQAMFCATDDLIRRRREKEADEKRAIEKRLESIEHRLKQLESAKK